MMSGQPNVPVNKLPDGVADGYAGWVDELVVGDVSPGEAAAILVLHEANRHRHRRRHSHEAAQR